MKVTIITVCFNSEETTLDTILSVQKQSYGDIEYIIIDGVSIDRTLDVINNNLSRIEHVACESDKGIYDAMNKGIALATGSIIGILNSDDFYLNQFVVSDVVKEFENNKNVDLLFGNVDFV